MIIPLLWIKWACRLNPRYYRDSDKVDITRVMLEAAALKATFGKLGFAGARPIEHSCKICGNRFWTERKHEDVCKMWHCYRTYYGGNW